MICPLWISCPGRRLQAALLFSACVQSLKQRLERVLQTLAERRALWIVAEVCVCVCVCVKMACHIRIQQPLHDEE